MYTLCTAEDVPPAPWPAPAIRLMPATTWRPSPECCGRTCCSSSVCGRRPLHAPRRYRAFSITTRTGRKPHPPGPAGAREAMRPPVPRLPSSGQAPTGKSLPSWAGPSSAPSSRCQSAQRGVPSQTDSNSTSKCPPTASQRSQTSSAPRNSTGAENAQSCSGSRQ